MKFFPFRKKRTVLREKNKSGFYHLLLRRKKETWKKNKPKLGPGKTIVFTWERYKNIIFGVVLGLGIFVAAAGVFFFSNLFVIREIVLTRKDFRVNVEGISTLLNSFRGSNIFLLPTEKLDALLRQKFPEIKMMTIQKNYPHTLQVVVETFPIVVQWEFRKLPGENPSSVSTSEETDETTEEKKDTMTVFVNAVGRISMTEPTDQDQTFIIFEETETLPEGIYFGYQVLPTSQLNDLLEARKLLEEQISLPIVSAQFYRAAQEIHFFTETGSAFWIDFFSPLSEQIAKIGIAAQEANFLSEEPIYIDLRIPGKVIYKEKP